MKHFDVDRTIEVSTTQLETSLYYYVVIHMRKEDDMATSLMAIRAPEDVMERYTRLAQLPKRKKLFQLGNTHKNRPEDIRPLTCDNSGASYQT